MVTRSRVLSPVSPTRPRRHTPLSRPWRLCGGWGSPAVRHPLWYVNILSGLDAIALCTRTTTRGLSSFDRLRTSVT
jgi:hypothetical protein